MGLTEQREGIETGRLDMFVDGAFAFTLTLLVIGGDRVPNSAAALLHVLGGIPAFAVCFSLIACFRHGHVRRRRRCPRADGTGLWLSLLLPGILYVLMFLIGPLTARFRRGHGLA
jgi:uncharacterized membrane protein